MGRSRTIRISCGVAGLLAGMVVGYVVIAGPVVYLGVRGSLPKGVFQAFCVPLFWAFGTPLWGAVGSYLGWWASMGDQGVRSSSHVSDVQVALASFALVSAVGLAYWALQRSKWPYRCPQCGEIARMRSFRVYSRRPLECSRCGGCASQRRATQQAHIRGAQRSV